MNASMRPSGESAGEVAESAKLVSCVYCAASRFGGLPESGHASRAAADDGDEHCGRRRQPTPWRARERRCDGAGASALCRTARRRSTTMSRIDWKRSAGSFSSAFSTTTRSGSGTSSGSGPAGRWMIACRTSRSDAPVNGRRPASSFVQHDAERENIAAGVERLSRSPAPATCRRRCRR